MVFDCLFCFCFSCFMGREINYWKQKIPNRHTWRVYSVVTNILHLTQGTIGSILSTKMVLLCLFQLRFGGMALLLSGVQLTITWEHGTRHKTNKQNLYQFFFGQKKWMKEVLQKSSRSQASYGIRTRYWKAQEGKKGVSALPLPFLSFRNPSL